jgi:hypothetical protein
MREANAQATESDTADLTARRMAAELIAQYIQDRIRGGDIEESWPTSPSDPALEDIGTYVFRLAGNRRLSQEMSPADRADSVKVLHRCRLFLLSDRTYGWGSICDSSVITFFRGSMMVLMLILILAAFEQEPGVGSVALLLGALGCFAAMLGRPKRLRLPNMETMTSGDYRYWPFELEEDLKAAIQEENAPPG